MPCISASGSIDPLSGLQPTCNADIHPSLALKRYVLVLKVAKVFTANNGDLLDREVVCKKVGLQRAHQHSQGGLVESLKLESFVLKVVSEPLLPSLSLVCIPPGHELPQGLDSICREGFWTIVT